MAKSEHRLFGQTLVEQEVITQPQLDEAIHKQQTTMSNRRLGEVLLRLGYITKRHISLGLAEQLGISTVKLFSGIKGWIPQYLVYNPSSKFSSIIVY